MKNNTFNINFLISDLCIENWKIHTIKQLLKNLNLNIRIYYIDDLKNKNNQSVRYYKAFSLFYRFIGILEANLFKLNMELLNCSCISDDKQLKNLVVNSKIDNLHYLKNNGNDVIINFTNIPFFQINQIFKLKNIWSISTGNSLFNDIFSGLEEVIYQRDVFKISIVQNYHIKNKKKSVILSSFSRIDKVYISNTISFGYAKIPNLLEKAIKDHLNHTINPIAEILNIKGISLFKSLLILPILYGKKLFLKLSDFLFFDQWILMIHLKDKNDNVNYFEIESFKKLLPPKDRIWADPFVINRNGNYHVFIEELILKEGKGFISHFTINNNGVSTIPQKIIEEDFHLSYPFLFEDNGCLYMLPETNKNKSITLYKCIEFPLKWKYEMNLMEDIDANDSSLFFKDDKYWLLTNLRTNKFMSCDDELHIFYSDTLLSKTWTPHSLNPVVSDVRNSRSAGKLYFDANTLIRPTQNCSKHYGYALNFQKVLNLNTTGFEEITLKSIFPLSTKNIKSLHTFNRINDFTIIDAQQRRLKF
jgi:hypothetical protein